MHTIEYIKLGALGALIIGQIILFVVVFRIIGWEKFFPFMHKESVEALENKIFSFDKAMNAKVITNQDGIIVSINQTAERLFGYLEKDIKGVNLNLLLPKQHKDHFIEQMIRLKTEGELDKSSRTTAVKKSGEEFPVEMVLRRRLIGQDYTYLFIFIDRTHDQKIANEFKQVIDIMKIKLDILSKGEELGHIGSWLWNIETKKMLVSNGYKEIIGLEEKGNEFDTVAVRRKVFEKDEEIVNQAIEKAFSGKPYQINYRIKRARDFKLVRIESKATPIMNDTGKKVEYIYGFTRFIEAIDIVTE